MMSVLIIEIVHSAVFYMAPSKKVFFENYGREMDYIIFTSNLCRLLIGGNPLMSVTKYINKLISVVYMRVKC